MLPQLKCFIVWLVMINMRAHLSLVAQATPTGGDVEKLKQLSGKYSRILDSTADKWDKIELIKDVVADVVELIPEVGSLIARVLNSIDTKPDAVDAVNKLRASMKREFARLERVIEKGFNNLQLQSRLAEFRRDVSDPLKSLRDAVEHYLSVDTAVRSAANSTLFTKCGDPASTLSLPFIVQRMSTILTDGCDLSRGSASHQLISHLRVVNTESFDGSLSSEEIQKQKEFIGLTYKVPIHAMPEYLTAIDRKFSRSDRKWEGETIPNFMGLLTKYKNELSNYNSGIDCIVDLVFERCDYKRAQVGQYVSMVIKELEIILMASPICHAVLFEKDEKFVVGKLYIADIMRDIKPVLTQLSEYIPDKWKKDAATREEAVLNQTLDQWIDREIDWKKQHGEPTATILSRVADIGLENYKRFVVLLPPADAFPFLWERNQMVWHWEGIQTISVKHQIGWAIIIRITRHSNATSFGDAVAKCVMATSDWLKNNYNNPDAWKEFKACDTQEISFIGATVRTGLFDCDLEGQWASETWEASDQLIGHMNQFYFPPAGFYWPWCWQLFFCP